MMIYLITLGIGLLQLVPMHLAETYSKAVFLPLEHTHTRTLSLPLSFSLSFSFSPSHALFFRYILYHSLFSISYHITYLSLSLSLILSFTLSHILFFHYSLFSIILFFFVYLSLTFLSPCILFFLLFGMANS